MRRPVRWLKYPQIVWWIMLRDSVQRARKLAGLVSSFRIKHMSPLMFFSPTHIASEKRFAVALGSNPCLICLGQNRYNFHGQFLFFRKRNNARAYWRMRYNRQTQHFLRLVNQPTKHDLLTCEIIEKFQIMIFLIQSYQIV
jgi:hypothetical protein